MKRVIFRAFTVWIILVMVYNLKNYCGYEWYLEPFPFWKEYGYWFLEKPGYWPKNPSPSYYALCGKDPFNLPVFGYLFVFVAISGLQTNQWPTHHPRVSRENHKQYPGLPPVACPPPMVNCVGPVDGIGGNDLHLEYFSQARSGSR
jgi:hypothetical protein